MENWTNVFSGTLPQCAKERKELINQGVSAKNVVIDEGDIFSVLVKASALADLQNAYDNE
jgi:hypothetical protein